MGFSVQHLTFRRANNPVLLCEDLSFEADDGSTIAILGRNGSGKTTLLRLLAGLERPTAVDGTQNADSSVVISEGGKQLVKADARMWGDCLTGHASLVFQHYTDVVFEWQKVDKALEWVRPQKDDYFINVVSMFPALTLPAGEAKYWGQLSGGQKQALALARALLRDPDILLMDEPFASFDASLRHKVQEALVKTHAAQGKKHRALVLVTHDIDEAVFLAQKILIVDGPPLRIVHEIRNTLPLALRDPTFRWSQQFVDIRKAVFEEFSKLPLPGS
jgi:NitT/TauT family transport system ATP-binding protein